MFVKSTHLGLLLELLMYTCLITSVPDNLYNVALYKPAFQSSTFWDWISIKGNDGDTTVAAVGGQCTATLYENNSWWMVDLLDTYVITSVILTNRNDHMSYARRLHNFQIEVFSIDPRTTALSNTGDICYNQTAAASIGTFTWNCSKPLVGRYVRLFRFTVDTLNFCELQVKASPKLIETNAFQMYQNRKLNKKPILELTLSRSMMCGLECLKKRYTVGCTAFHWFPSTRLCQLLNVDPRDVTVVTKLVSVSDVRFYIIKY